MLNPGGKAHYLPSPDGAPKAFARHGEQAAKKLPEGADAELLQVCRRKIDNHFRNRS